MAVTDLIPRLRSRAPAVRNESLTTHPLASFHERMDQLFDDLWRSFDAPGLSGTSSLGFPRVEVSESDRQFTVEAELPGIDEKDVELVLHDGVLAIRGEKRSENEDRSRRVSERFYGSFERRIALPADVQEDQVSAVFNKGVLRVTLPKTAEALQRTRRIPINSK